MKKHYWVSIVLLFLFSCVSTDQDQDLAIEYYNVGNAFFEIDQFEKAEEYFIKSLTVNSDFQKARYNLIQALIAAEDFETAQKHADYMLEVDPENQKVKELVAYIKYKSGDLRESYDIYIYLYDYGYVSTRILNNAAKISYQLEEYKQSKKYLNELLMEKEDKDYYYLAGLIYEALEDNIKASQYYNLYLEKGGDDVDVVEKLIALYRSSDDYDNLKEILLYVIDKGIEELVPLSQFELGSTSLLYDNDFSVGYEYLKRSIESGFKEVDKINALIEEPDLIEADKIRQLFVDSKILK